MLRFLLCLLLRALWVGAVRVLVYGLPLLLVTLIAVDRIEPFRPHGGWLLPAAFLLLLGWSLRRGWIAARPACRKLCAGALAHHAERMADPGRPDSPASRRSTATLTALAREGHVEAYLPLGRAHARGIGTPFEPIQAERWLGLAAAQGEAEALVELGEMFERRNAGKADLHDAVACYQRAGDMGSHRAWFHLGRLYEEGTLVAPDFDKAIKCYVRAAEAGNVVARQRLKELNADEPPVAGRDAEGPMRLACPKCGREMRIPRPYERRLGICGGCAHRFMVSLDRFGNVRIEPVARSDAPLTAERALAALGLAEGADPAEVRRAYKAQISRYHPDKVSSLGDELRRVAEEKSKEINAAFRYLEDAGYLG